MSYVDFSKWCDINGLCKWYELCALNDLCYVNISGGEYMIIFYTWWSQCNLMIWTNGE